MLDPNVDCKSCCHETADERQRGIAGIWASPFDRGGGGTGIVDVPCQEAALQVSAQNG